MKKSLVFSFVLMAVVLCSNLFAQSTESLMNTGSEMLQRGAYSQAVTAFRQVVSREPRNFEAQFNLAFAYLGWGRNSNAVEEFKKALGLQPNSSQAWANMAVAYENMGKSGEALGALSNAVKYDPSNITARMNLAAMYANNNKLTQAINEYTAVIKMDGSNSDALLNLSKCLISANKIEEAKNYLREATMADPQNAEARFELAYIYWKKEKNPDQALTELRLAVNARPDVGKFYEDIASILEEKGDKPGAAETLKKALVYTDDVISKEKIQGRIDRLEGKTGSAGATPSTPAFQMQTIKRETRDTTATRRIETAPVKVDFGGLLDEEEDESTPVLDLKEAAKKKAQ